jgi:hypothetical protein
VIWSHQHILWAILWGAFSWGWASVVFWVTEIIFIRQIAKTANEDDFMCPSRNVQFEKIVYRNAMLLGALIYGILSFLVLGIFLSS